MNCSCRPWTITSSETARELTIAEARRLAHYDVYMAGYKAGRESYADLLHEIALSGVESDLEGIGYVTVHIDRWLWEEINEELDQ